MILQSNQRLIAILRGLVQWGLIGVRASQFCMGGKSGGCR